MREVDVKDRRRENATKAWAGGVPVRGFSQGAGGRAFAMSIAIFAVGTGLVPANGEAARFCSATASAQHAACLNEIQDDFFTARAICINISDAVVRKGCFLEAEEVFEEGRNLCRQQRRARGQLCRALGEDRYEPDFDPANFDDDFTNLTNPNFYFPLAIGNIWEYAAADETNRIEVLDKTKLIEGVTCIVANDLVQKEGGSEDTDDWYAHRQDGTVVYCGESVRDFETFVGDNPEEPELVAIEGSFKVGRDGDLSGTIFLAMPTVGTTYRQESSLGNAEDAATVLSTTYGFGDDPELDEFVPQALVELLCANDCVVTGDFTPIEPGVLQRKYYAHGIGLFLEVDAKSGGINQLVNCNFDARCAALPAP